MGEVFQMEREPEHGGTAWQDGGDCLTLDFNQKETVFCWRQLPDCDEFVGARRSKHTMVGYKSAMYVFGGDNGKQMLNDMIRYDPHERSWNRAFTMGQLPAPRYHHSAVVYQNAMFVFGGYTGDIHSNSNLANKNDLFEYKFSTGQWSDIRCEGKLPPARSAHGAAVYDGQMWVFGGFDGHTRLNDMWCINLKGPLYQWNEVVQMGDCPPPCCNFAITVVRDSMYLFSGQSGAKSTNSLFQFNFASRTWARISTEHILRSTPTPPERRYGHSMVGYGRHLYVFGGAAESIYSIDLHSFDLETQLWSVVEPARGSKTPAGRLFHSAVVIADAMYIFGGTIDNNVRSGEMFRFQLNSYPRCTLHEDLGRLRESRQFCDLRFRIGKDRVPIYAHIAIVAARSSFLRGKIRQAKEALQDAGGGVAPLAAAAGNAVVEQPAGGEVFPSRSSEEMPGSPSSSSLRLERDPNCIDVEIVDAEPFAFEMILDYMYTDKIDPTQRGQEPESNGVVLLMMDVYRLSLHFTMKRLESLCIFYLESMIGSKNVLAALQNASRLNLAYIKEYCLKFITKESNYNQIVMTREFEVLEQPLMVEIIRRRQIPTLRPQLSAPSPALAPGNLDAHSASSAAAIEYTLEYDLRSFLEDDVGSEFCDLTLMCHGTAIPVHKVILAARSGYFEAMFRSFMPQTNTVSVTVGEIVPSLHAFRSLLKYVYYGCFDMPPEDSLYLFSAPCFYNFTNSRLQAYCKENLELNITANNVLEILEAADRIHANEMKRHALNLIVMNFNYVTRLSKLKELSKDLLLEIIEAVAHRLPRPSVSISED